MIIFHPLNYERGNRRTVSNQFGKCRTQIPRRDLPYSCLSSSIGRGGHAVRAADRVAIPIHATRYRPCSCLHSSDDRTGTQAEVEPAKAELMNRVENSITVECNM